MMFHKLNFLHGAVYCKEVLRGMGLALDYSLEKRSGDPMGHRSILRKRRHGRRIFIQSRTDSGTQLIYINEGAGPCVLSAVSVKLRLLRF
jgi:hypothetical protein